LAQAAQAILTLVLVDQLELHQYLTQFRLLAAVVQGGQQLERMVALAAVAVMELLAVQVTLHQLLHHKVITVELVAAIHQAITYLWAVAVAVLAQQVVMHLAKQLALAVTELHLQFQVHQ
jgi:hypothetical protein